MWNESPHHTRAKLETDDVENGRYGTPVLLERCRN